MAVQATQQTAKTDVVIGGIDTGVEGYAVETQFAKVDCGTAFINEYWGSYLDYSPYTKIEIYLPYIGIKELSPDNFMGKNVHVEYHVDLLTGAAVAFISDDSRTLSVYPCNIASQIPLTGCCNLLSRLGDRLPVFPILYHYRMSQHPGRNSLPSCRKRC
jgi:hypothetical protein